ncbi:hypothetical protein SASPL_136928 [Salvia splendens]|uniref:Uncharacterized protein n=1 Tax=Salvia splendens TaxID=180675 RepID=A0A8X8X2M8_SALSN|nr:hypothetical protein SASPL_136928 [Salvia splendens]
MASSMTLPTSFFGGAVTIKPATATTCRNSQLAVREQSKKTQEVKHESKPNTDSIINLENRARFDLIFLIGHTIFSSCRSHDRRLWAHGFQFHCSHSMSIGPA